MCVCGTFSGSLADHQIIFAKDILRIGDQEVPPNLMTRVSAFINCAKCCLAWEGCMPRGLLRVCEWSV